MFFSRPRVLLDKTSSRVKSHGLAVALNKVPDTRLVVQSQSLQRTRASAAFPMRTLWTAPDISMFSPLFPLSSFLFLILVLASVYGFSLSHGDLGVLGVISAFFVISTL